MAISLQKGQKISLAKVAADAVIGFCMKQMSGFCSLQFIGFCMKQTSGFCFLQFIDFCMKQMSRFCTKLIIDFCMKQMSRFCFLQKENRNKNL